MRVGGGITQHGSNAVLKSLGDEVFEPLGFVVKLFQWVVQHLKEEGLDEPMMTHDLKCAMPARRGKPDATATLVIDQRLGFSGQALQHVGDGRWGNAQALRQGRAADAALRIAQKRVDGLEVVVDRLAGPARS